MELSKLMRWLPVGKVPEVNARELHEALGGSTPPRILDVRTPVEWRRSCIPGAINISITELGSRIRDLPFERHEPIVAICLSAHRSIPAVRMLKSYGYGNVSQLQGGMLAWWKADLPALKHDDSLPAEGETWHGK